MKIGDEVAIHGFIDEIRKDTVIIRNEGGYFGTIPEEIQDSGVFAEVKIDHDDLEDIVKEQIKKALPKGQWERHYSRPGVYADLFWYCSNCGEKCGYDWAEHFKFCPNCGADMRKTHEVAAPLWRELYEQNLMPIGNENLRQKREGKE